MLFILNFYRSFQAIGLAKKLCEKDSPGRKSFKRWNSLSLRIYILTSLKFYIFLKVVPSSVSKLLIVIGIS